MTTFTFGGVSTSSIAGLIVRDVRRPLLPPRRDIYAEVPGRVGAWPFFDKYGDRSITVSCAFAVGSSAVLRTQTAAFAALLDLAGKQQLIFADQSDRFWFARLDDYTEPAEQVGFAEFDLKFRCDPHSYATSVSTQVLGPTSTEPYTTTFSVTTQADTSYQVDVAPSGAVLTGGFALTVNGDVLSYGTSVADGQVCAINGETFTVTNNGALSMATVSGTFGRLINGTNSITFDRVNGTASTTLTFTWRRRYI